MNPDNAVKAAWDSSRTGSLSEWYSRQPDVRRLWVFEADVPCLDDAAEVHVVVGVAPVCDSDDISPIWLARSGAWQRQLQRLIGRTVHLDCFDAATEVVPSAEEPEGARVCLASIAWRE
jgi:hypothetical protein